MHVHYDLLTVVWDLGIHIFGHPLVKLRVPPSKAEVNDIDDVYAGPNAKPKPLTTGRSGKVVGAVISTTGTAIPIAPHQSTKVC